METNKVESSLVISDNVWRRVVQIVQEAMLTGVDCVDLLRQVRVQTNGSALELTSEYRKMVSEHHEKLVAEAAQRKSEQEESNLIRGS